MTSTITVPAYITNQGYKDWWCPCGIYPSDVVAAYQPKGAASFIASLINLANPGIHNAIDPGGINTPGWNNIDGWVSAGNYLTSDIIPTSLYWSMMAKISNNNEMINNINGSLNTLVNGQNGLGSFFGSIVYWNGGYKSSSSPAVSGIFGYAGNKGYYNGVEESGTIDQTHGPSYLQINPLGFNRDNTYEGVTLNLQAEVWYNKVLTPSQMFDLYTAMNAL